MELNELFPSFKKREKILRENVISVVGNRDRPNDCLCYMLYCLSIRQPFNLAYYDIKRMANVPNLVNMVLPYGMLLTRLFRHVSPLDVQRVHRFIAEGKRPHPPTNSSSS